MKRTSITLLSLIAPMLIWAQNVMQITYKDGSVAEIPVERIDSITFVEKTTIPTTAATLEGRWFWGKTQAGYCELLTINADRTYTGYDLYLDYGFDSQTYGTWTQNGIMLNLWSNGYGYKRIYRWFIMGLTENALEVMTQMGNFIYYRVQPEVIRLKVGGTPLTAGSDEQFVFADGIYASITDGQLQGLRAGTTYVQRLTVSTNTIRAYQVIVE